MLRRNSGICRHLTSRIMQKHLKSIIMAISVILVIIACFWVFDHRQQRAEQELREQLNGLKLQYAPAERDTIRDSATVITQQVLQMKEEEYKLQAYDRQLLSQAREIAKEKGIKVVEGVYVGTQGPTYETPAEYKMYRILGGDAVGMSTVPEVIVARHCGMRVFGVSIITDLGVEGKIVEVSHEEVQRAANAVQPLMAEIFREMIRRG